MTFNTGNPIGSTDARDRIDNAENIDIIENSTKIITHHDRMGNPRTTRYGMEETHRSQISAHESEHDAQISAHESEHDAQISAHESEFDIKMAGMAFSRVGTFTSGYSLTDSKQTLLYATDGHDYGWAGTFPKVVTAGATPATSGGIGAGAWVDRTDVTLRGELAAPVGADLVGFSGGDPDVFAAITVAEALSASLRFDDFKGATDDDKWASLVAYSTLEVVQSLSVVFSSRIHNFYIAPATLGKPCSIFGNGGRSSLFIFHNCRGLQYDLLSYTSRQTQTVISDVSFIADSQNQYDGLSFVGALGAGPHQHSLILSRVSFMGMRDLYHTGNDGDEWNIALKLKDVTEVHLNDCYVCGSRNNAKYVSISSSSGISAQNVGGFRISKTSINTVGSCGIDVYGQCEGAIIDSLTVVGATHGVLFRDLINPSNNHCITNSHIAAYLKGIEFRKNSDIEVNSLACYISNLFLLERAPSRTKPSYTALELHVKRSSISNITIQSNSSLTPNRRALVVSNQFNSVSNISCYNAGDTLTLDGASGYTFYNNIVPSGNYNKDLVLGDSHGAVGSALTGEANANAYPVRCEVFKINDLLGHEKYLYNGNKQVFGGGRQETTMYVDYMTVANSSSTYDARVLFYGGTANQDGTSDCIIYSRSVAFEGNITPRLANGSTCGTYNKPWSGGFTQTAFTVTSDERAKTVPGEITDAMLDAAAEVDWCMFQYLDRVEEKGTDGARWHFGAIAQRFVESFQKHGLDPFRFAFICYDEWDAVAEVIGEDGETISEAVEAGSRYGIRYEQAIILKQKQIERDHDRRIDALLSRIDALEAK